MRNSTTATVYTIEGGAILVPKKEFNIRATLECGQVFRYAPLEHGRWELVSGARRCKLYEQGNFAVISAQRRDLPYFVRYFDLERSYAPILRELRSKEPAALMKAAAAHGQGMRILHQEPFETLISFIISTNNNIKRIQGIIERLCAALGKPLDGNGTLRRAFPEPEAMARAGEAFYRDIGCGYRAPWIADAAEKAVRSTELERLSGLPAEELTAALQTFNGIGPKAADCIALFAYGRYDVFPVDTWVKKLYRDLFGDSPPERVMRNNLIGKFGRYAGAVQQYLFYYYRSGSLQGRS